PPSSCSGGPPAMNRKTLYGAAVMWCLAFLPAGSGEGPLGAQQPPAGKGDKDIGILKDIAILNAKPLEVQPKDGGLQKLFKQRYNAALAEVQARVIEITAGTKTPDEFLFEATKRLAAAGLEALDRPADQVAMMTDLVALAKSIEMSLDERAK